MLDPNNDVHLYCLHYLFIPRINAHLQHWKNAWIKHPLQTEGNLTPEQLWVAGLQRIACSGSVIANEVFEAVNDVSICVLVVAVLEFQKRFQLGIQKCFLVNIFC